LGSKEYVKTVKTCMARADLVFTEGREPVQELILASWSNVQPDFLVYETREVSAL
jgi:hypothetical protein